MLKHFLSTLILTLISQIASAQSIPVQMDAHQHVVMFQKGVDAFLVGEYDKCDDYWLPLARAGDPMAARNMGLLFHKGLGVRKDVEEAILYYKIAADAGVTSAQLSLGLIYLKGDGVERNLKSALKYLTSAHHAGNAVAQYNLGLMYEYGVGVKRDMNRAMELYNIAGSAGHHGATLKASKGHNDNDIVPEKIRDAYNSLKENDKDFGTGPNLTEAKNLSFNKKKDIYEDDHRNTRHDIISFNENLQNDGPKLIFRDLGDTHKTYSAKTPAPKNPYDQAKDGQTRGRETDDGFELFSVKEDAEDRALVRAEKAYKHAMSTSGMRKEQKITEAIEIWEDLYMQGSGEAAYRLGKLYHDRYNIGSNSQNELYRKMAYKYWKKGAYFGSPKARDALDALRATLTEEELLKIERETLSE